MADITQLPVTTATDWGKLPHRRLRRRMERKEMTPFGSEKKEGYPNPNPNWVKHREEKEC